MSRIRPLRRGGTFALAAVLALATAACGSDDEAGGTTAAPDAPAATAAPDATTADTPAATDAPSAATNAPDTEAPAGEPVTIEWWHIQNNDPGKANWQAMADAYTDAHPNVTININVMENEAFKAALQTNMQAGDVPDLFQSWGGGVLRDQVDAGMVPVSYTHLTLPTILRV